MTLANSVVHFAHWVVRVSCLTLLIACAPAPAPSVGRGAVEDAAAEQDSPALPGPKVDVGSPVSPDTAVSVSPDTALGKPPVDTAAPPPVDAAVDLPTPDLRPADTAVPDTALPMDMAPDVSFVGKKILFVVGDVVPVAGDLALKQHLEARKYVVTLKSDGVVVPTDADGKDLVIISASVDSATVSMTVGTKLVTMKVPALCLESGLFAAMKLTGPTANTDWGATTAQNQLAIIDANHYLAAGLSGTVKVANTTANRMVWGVPGVMAKKVATLVGMPNQVAIFGYELGSPMVGATATAKRLGWFGSEGISADLTAEGLRLFDAAVEWCLL